MAYARNSIALTICDEVCAVLANNGITAYTDPAPHVDLSKVRKRDVFVVPGPVDVHPITRGSNEERVDVAICIVDRPDGVDLDKQLDAMHRLCELFSRRVLPHGTVTAVTPEHDLESWWRLRVFSGNITLSVWLGVQP